jgi:hypothetical protein
LWNSCSRGINDFVDAPEVLRQRLVDMCGRDGGVTHGNGDLVKVRHDVSGSIGSAQTSPADECGGRRFEDREGEAQGRAFDASDRNKITWRKRGRDSAPVLEKRQKRRKNRVFSPTG